MKLRDSSEKELEKTLPSALEVEVQLRQRNQITVPVEAVDGLGVAPGDRLVLTVDPAHRRVEIRPLRQSYAGVAGTSYGKTAREIDAYIKRERAAWDE